MAVGAMGLLAFPLASAQICQSCEALPDWPKAVFFFFFFPLVPPPKIPTK